jgi:1,4-dihydroxy-2-naphthoate polyprenyltransferase
MMTLHSPPEAEINRDSAMPTFKDYLVATRPWSFSMSAISVSLGTLVARGDGPIQLGWFAVVLVGVVLCHAAGNVLNDYFDSKSGVDQADSGTVLYRPHPVLGGLMSQRAVLAEAVALFAAAAVLGLALVFWCSPHVLWIAAAGLFLAVFYTGGPLTLKYRALGEVAIFLIWGPLMFLGAYVVQRQELAASPLVASVPFGALVALVLFANNMRDIEQDARTGIRTLGTLLGSSRSLVAFVAFVAFAYLFVVGAVVAGALTPWVLLAFGSVPTAIGLIRVLRKSVPPAADAMVAKLDTIFGLLFLAGLLIARVIGS